MLAIQPLIYKLHGKLADDDVLARGYSISRVHRPLPLTKFGLPCVESVRDDTVPCQRYLTTPEAAKYLRKSVSWLLRSGIPYLPGRPNLYSVQDLDNWFALKKWMPKD